MTIATETANQNILSIKLSQSSFHNALSLVSKAVAKHGIQPILSNILISCNPQDNTVTLAATDLNLSLAAKVSCEIIHSGEITVPAQKILELVSKLSHEDLHFSSDENCLLTIKCGRSKFELKGLSSEQFPRDFLKESEDSKKSISIPKDLLKDASDLVGFASDKRETNSILNGICFQISQDGVELAATDGSRLACFADSSINLSGITYNAAAQSQEKSEGEEQNKKDLKVVIPFRSFVELGRMLQSIEDENITCILDSQHKGNINQITFKSKEKVFSTSLLDGTYPKYQQLVPKDHSQVALVDRIGLLSCLERVSVLANERTKVVKLFFEANNNASGSLNISASTPDLGEAQDQIDIESYTGNDFTIAFNVNYMIECLRSLNSTKIQIKTSEPLKPIIIDQLQIEDPSENKGETKKAGLKDGQNYFYLLMPVQVRTTN